MSIVVFILLLGFVAVYPEVAFCLLVTLITGAIGVAIAVALGLAIYIVTTT